MTPGHAPAISRARELISQARHAQAEQVLRRHLQKFPADAFACYLLAFSLMALNKPEQAVFFAERAVKDPRADASTFDVLGTLLMQLDRKAEALVAFRRAIELDPRHASAWNGRCMAASQSDQLDEGVVAARKVLELAPENAGFVANAAMAFADAWLDAERLAFLRDGVRRHPADVPIRTYLTSLLNYSDEATPEEVFRQHVELGRLIESRVVPPPAPETPPLEGRALRLGLLSPDFRQHSVSFFIEPLLRELKTAANGGNPGGACEVFCYAALDVPDPTTARLRALVGEDHWRDVMELTDQAAAAIIRRDRLDVLIDLAGYTAGTRVAVLAHRPAPVQGSYLGYPNTTGLTRADFRIADSITDPPGSGTGTGADALATERILRLDPCFLCYRLSDDALPPRPPRNAADPVTFVSFNALIKVTPTTIRLWSRVLHAVAGSRLVIKSKPLGHQSVRDRVLAAFAAHGIDSSRVELLPWVASLADHAALYQRADIALDSYPYHGTTTTCDALSMGVPVVTLAGRSHASRVGASILSVVGLPELVARSEEEFVAIAVGLAADAGRRNVLRATLHEQMARSPLCDAPGYARRFVEAVREFCAERAKKSPRM